MPMIVANKRRIASVFVDSHFDARVAVELTESQERPLSYFGSAVNIPILKFSAQKFAKKACQTAVDKPR
jgi:hypothetical protein